MSMQKLYFPNLNGLRFIAALLVIFHHIEQYKKIYNLPNLWEMPFIKSSGKLGVDLFFVLSGFLITYIMLYEEEKFNKIRIWDFYKRRIFRIWPLYFLILILAFFVLPYIDFFSIPNISQDSLMNHFWSNLILFIFFFPNLAICLYSPIPFASQSWSIGTEEQFYLVWPLLLTKIKKHRIQLMFFIVLVYWVINITMNIYFKSSEYEYLKQFWNTFRINCMAIGALFSILYFKKHKYLKYLLNLGVFIISIITVTFLMIKGIYIPYFNAEIYSYLFAIIILNLAVNSKLNQLLEFKLINYLGKISYGLYMYHSIAIVLVINSMQYFKMDIIWIIYPISILITIGFSAASYKLIESYFLKIRK